MIENQNAAKRTLQRIMALDIRSFFHYVSSIPYGNQDRSGALHFSGDPDFTVQDYAFSSPEEIVKNNCCWCWDLAELIRLYCAEHQIPCKAYFMEYRSDALHQTHTQVFLYDQETWSAAPDNCLGLAYGTPRFANLDDCVAWFTGMFTDYLKAVLKKQYDESRLLVKPYSCTFSAGTSEEEYLSRIRL